VDPPELELTTAAPGGRSNAGRSLLAGLGKTALNRQGDFDAISPGANDWLPILLTPSHRHAAVPLVRHGIVATWVMIVGDHGRGPLETRARLPSTSAAQAGDLSAWAGHEGVGNGFDPGESTSFRPRADPEAGLAGREQFAPEKGMERCGGGGQLGRRLSVWGFAGGSPPMPLAVEGFPSPPAASTAGFPSSEAAFQAELGGCAVAC